MPRTAQGGLFALCPKRRKDRASLRAFGPELLEQAVRLRCEGEKDKRATKSVIDILVRQHRPEPLKIARSTLDRHFHRLGVSRRALHALGRRPFTRIETFAPFELVVTDLHHGPYVRVGPHDEARRALLCAFIDHYSRYVPEGRYYLHEDFATLRFGFRRLLAASGLAVKLYADNGPSFQAHRFHGACKLLGITLVHSKAYVAESRGVIERYNRTLKEQFESEVRERDELLTLDELNTYYQAWLAERYHRDVHSETGQSPLELSRDNVVVRPAPEPALVDELLRLHEKRTVHHKWSTVEVHGIRYSVDGLRGRRVGVLYDPFALEYVLITFDGRVVQRAFPQKAGEIFAEPKPDQSQTPRTDYLELLRRDHEQRSQSELAALRLAPAPLPSELALADLVVLLESCRGSRLSRDEQKAASDFWRKMRPIPADAAREATDAALRRQGQNPPPLRLPRCLNRASRPDAHQERTQAMTMSLQEHFGLQQVPFPKAASEACLLRYPPLLDTVERLRFAVDRDCPALLVAESGCGKSTATRLFARSLDAASYNVLYICLTTVKPFGFVSQIAAASDPAALRASSPPP